MKGFGNDAVRTLTVVARVDGDILNLIGKPPAYTRPNRYLDTPPQNRYLQPQNQNVQIQPVPPAAPKKGWVKRNPTAATALFLTAVGGGVAYNVINHDEPQPEGPVKEFRTPVENNPNVLTWQEINKRIEKASALHPAVIPLRNGMLKETGECAESPSVCFDRADDGKTIIPYFVSGTTATRVPRFATAISTALEKIENVTSIRYVPVDKESDARHVFGVENDPSNTGLAWAPYPSRDKSKQFISFNRAHWPKEKKPLDEVHTVAHEEGHALGLPHIEGHPESMMNTTYGQWTNDDIENAKREGRTLPKEGRLFNASSYAHSPVLPDVDAAALRAMYGCDGRETGCDGKRKPVKDSTTYERDNLGKWRAQVGNNTSLPNQQHGRGFNPPARR